MACKVHESCVLSIKIAEYLEKTGPPVLNLAPKINETFLICGSLAHLKWKWCNWPHELVGELINACACKV